MSYLGLETIRQGNSAACIQDIFTIHFPVAQTVLDATYGKGRFWSWPHNLHIVGVDIDPPGPVSLVADYRNLPFPQRSFDVLVFDPVFIFSRGIRGVMGTKGFFRGAEAALPQDRIHSKVALCKPKNPADLLNHYRCIFEQAHIATQGLICKGQDLITGTSRDYWSVNVINMARDMGLGWPKDILIQHSPAARMTDPRWKQQYHFRTSHCFYIVWAYAPRS